MARPATLWAVETAAALAATGVLIGLATWAWLPEQMDWGRGDVPRYVGVVMVPLLGLVVSLLLALFMTWDPLMDAHGTASQSAIAAVIAIPCFLALPLQLVVLWANTTDHVVGTVAVTVLSGVLMILLALVFGYVEQNHVVGIRDPWTLRSSQVWDDTHVLAWKLFLLAGVAAFVLAFIVPPGIWQIVLVINLFLIPTLSAVIYSYVISDYI